MALIDDISSGNVLLTLSGGVDRTTSSNSILGRGATSSGADAANVISALDRASTAFQNSFLRLSTASVQFQVTLQTVDRLVDVAEDALAIAEDAADPSRAEVDRLRLNSDFQQKIQEFNKIIDGAETEDINFLDIDDLEDVLTTAGIDPRVSSELSEAFRVAGGRDDLLGTEDIEKQDLAFFNTVTDQVEVAKASSVKNALKQDVKSQGQALIAVDAFGQLIKELKSDQESVETILQEISAAQDFALAADLVFQNGIAEIESFRDAYALSQDLAATIRRETADSAIGAHSDLDRDLAKELLGD